MRRRDLPYRRGVRPAQPCTDCGTVWGWAAKDQVIARRIGGLCNACHDFQRRTGRPRGGPIQRHTDGPYREGQQPAAPCRRCGTLWGYCNPHQRIRAERNRGLCMACYQTKAATLDRKSVQLANAQERERKERMSIVEKHRERFRLRSLRCRDDNRLGLCLPILNPYVDASEVWPTLLARLAYDRAWANIRKLAEAS